jgi:uncharacterized protein
MDGSAVTRGQDASKPPVWPAANTEACLRAAKPSDHPVGRYPGFEPGIATLRAGTVMNRGHRPLPCDIVFERDVEVPLRDGTVIYTDVFRPPGATDVPAIVAWSPYGKEVGGFLLSDFPFRMGIPKSATSSLEKFEAPDPAYWCLNGYAVINPDPRGVYRSSGDIQVLSRQEGRDGHDVIEWTATQPWSSGKVGLAGNSWLAMSQWYIAAERPEHLAAIAPWEGAADLYRHVMVAGGIPDPGFFDAILDTFCGPGKIDDISAATSHHPLLDEYWEQHRALVEDIEVPAYVVASWSNPVHTPGTIAAWQRLTSGEKWLRVHNAMEWPDFYISQDELRRFFDRYLRGIQNGWETTPKVRLAILNPGGKDEVGRPADTFPPAGTEHRPLYLDAATGSLAFARPTRPAEIRYPAADGQGKAEFTVRFEEDTELIGPLALRLFIEAPGGDDADIFAMVQKLNARGRLLVTRTVPLNNPIIRAATRLAHLLGRPEVRLLFYEGSWGCLRASHRALDGPSSKPGAPVHTHQFEEKLGSGEVVGLDIPLTRTALKFRAGEQLRLTIAGYKLNATPPPSSGTAIPDPPRTINRGEHVVHTGGVRDSHLLLPFATP